MPPVWETKLDVLKPAPVADIVEHREAVRLFAMKVVPPVSTESPWTAVPTLVETQLAPVMSSTRITLLPSPTSILPVGSIATCAGDPNV